MKDNELRDVVISLIKKVQRIAAEQGTREVSGTDWADSMTKELDKLIDKLK